MSTQIVPAESQLMEINQQQITAFSNANSFESAQRMAMALSSSTIVPESYRGKQNIGNCLIALEIAQRLGASPLAVMQNLYIVHGKPGWSAQFVIAAINSTNRYTPLRFEITGDGEKKQCVAWATEKETNQRLESPAVSLAMAKAEGWIDKNGSKWKTMPDLMLRYRAATFFGRLYASEVLLGMKTAEEVEDIEGPGFKRKGRIVELEPPTLEGNAHEALRNLVKPGNSYGVTEAQLLKHCCVTSVEQIASGIAQDLVDNWGATVEEIAKEEV